MVKTGELNNQQKVIVLSIESQLKKAESKAKSWFITMVYLHIS
jgi:hypothetical protein